MLHGLLLLVTKRADNGAWELSFSQTIRRPTPILQSQPDEEFAPEGCPTFPDPLLGPKLNGAQEKGLI